MSTPNPAPILTITLNPALDFATSVPRIVADEKLYCRPPRVDPGGGGVNVARTIGRLGGQATALVVAGGPTGARLMDLLEREGVAAQGFQTQADTRFSFAVTDEHTGAQQRFSLPGEPISEEEAQALLSTVESAIPQGAYVVLSGGVAPGLADDVPQQIQSRIAAKAARLVVDTSKAPLQHLIEAPRAPVHVLRVDRKEAAQAAQNPLIRLEDCIAFAASLVARGVAHHVVTGRGADGSVLVSRDMQDRKSVV